MKKFPHFLTALLAVVLVCALAIPAMAAGTINVMNSGTDIKYQAYKIFDVEEVSGNLVYSIDADPAASEWLADLADITDPQTPVSLFPGLKFTPDADPATKYIVEKLDDFSSPDFVAFLKDNLTGKTAIDTDEVGGHVFTGLDYGYYLIVSSEDDFTTLQSRASLTTVSGDSVVNIQNKNDMPLDKTVELDDGTDGKENDVYVGKVLDYTVSTIVPSVDDEETAYIFKLSDTMDPGLTFNVADPASDSVVVTINGVAVALTLETNPDALLIGDKIRINYDGDRPCGFEISLDMLTRGKDAALVGKAVEFTYSATVNDDAVGDVSKNKAELQYGNDPSHLIIKNSETKHYDAVVIINKYETGAPEQKLAGAQFILQRASDDKYYKRDGGEITWVVDEADAEVFTTDASGAAKIEGLADGEYDLIEIEAPIGYVLLSMPVHISIDSSAANSEGLTKAQLYEILTNTVSVENMPDSRLPSTGGIGTYIFYAIGGILLAAAVVVVIVTFRKKKETEA